MSGFPSYDVSKLPWRKLGTIQSGSELPHSKKDLLCRAKNIWDRISSIVLMHLAGFGHQHAFTLLASSYLAPWAARSVCQLVTTTIGEASAFSTGTSARKRWPSADTSYEAGILNNATGDPSSGVAPAIMTLTDMRVPSSDR
jgi:hypothetical protein